MTPVTKHETTIEADPKVPLIRIIREFDAPPEKVYRAHVDADLYKQWCGPRDLEMTIDTWDARSGGSWAFTHRRGDEAYSFHGCFHDLRPGEKIVQTFTFDGEPDGVSLETMRFEALPGGRTRLVGESLCDSFEGRDAWLASGMETGVNDGYDKLDELLAEAG